MRCSIIRRVSTPKQAAEDKTSLQDQLNDCLESIKQRNWTFVKDFNFGDTHGQDMKSHPLYAEIKQHIEQNQCDIIMTHRIDRTLRDKYFWLDLCDLLQQYSKLIASPFEIFDPVNIDHEFTLDIKSVFGHHERKRIRERAMRGMKGIKDKGHWTGGLAPLGYDYDESDKSHPLKINQTEAEAIRLIVDLIQQKKYTRMQIVQQLNDQGYRSKTDHPFSPRILRRILEPQRLLFYTGRRYNSKGEIIQANWEPIISLNDYQNLIGFKFKQMPFGWSREPKYLLTGLNIFKCGYCGHSVKTTNNRHKCLGGSFYYYCSGYYKTKGFCQKSKNIKMDLIDSIIINELKIRIKNYHIIEIGYQALINSDADAKALNNFNTHLIDLDKRKANLISAIELGTVPLQDVKQRLLEIDTDKITTQAKIAAIEQQHKQIDLTTIKELTKTIDKIDSFNLEDKREIIKLCIESIKLYQNGLIITYRFPIREDGRKNLRIQF